MNIMLIDIAPKNVLYEPYENLGLGYLASVLRQNGNAVRLLSFNIENLSFRKSIKRILTENPDLVGISVKNIHAMRMVKFVKKLRENGFQGHITLGGHFPTFNHQEILRDVREVDSVIRGEGEDTLLELTNRLAGKDFSSIHGLSYRIGNDIKINPPRKLIDDLDTLPFPARDHTDQILKTSGTISISASRGCYAHCSFCSIASFYDLSPGEKWRNRSAENVIDEIEFLMGRYDCNAFKFVDDQLFDFNHSEYEYVDALRKELTKRCLHIKFAMNCRPNHVSNELFTMLKDMGLKKVFLGIESAHQRGLNTFKKGTTIDMNDRALKILDSLKIDYDVGFIMIDPYTSPYELEKNLLYISELKQKIKNKECNISVTTSVKVFAGTPIYKRLEKEKRLLGNYLHGFDYRMENRKVKRFRYFMESIVEQKLLPLFNLFREIKIILNQKIAFKLSY